mgnify:CR=1 FL=1
MNPVFLLIINLVAFSPVEKEYIPNYWLPEIVVTAKRIREPLSEVAVDMKVITEVEIAKRGVRTVEELLKEEGFLDIRTTGIEGGLLTVGLRGFPADQLLVLYNGTALNSPANGCFDFYEIPISTIERIEIVKSPISSIYGANASSGVVNIISKEADKEGVSIEAKGDISDSNAKHLFGDVGYRKGSLRTNVNIARGSGKGKRLNSDFNRILTDVNISFLDLITTRFSIGKREVGVPGPIPSLTYIPAYGDSSTYSLYNRQKTKHFTTSAKFARDFGDVWVSSNIGYRKEDLRYTQVYEAYNENWIPYKANDNCYYITEQLTGSFQASYKYISSGIDVSQQEFWAYDSLYKDDNDSLLNRTFWNPDRLTKGFWASIKQTFFYNKIIASASLRWDKNSDYSNFLSYSGGFLFIAQNNLRIGTSFGKGFRAPTFNELYWPDYGNRALKPEESFQGNTYIDANLKEIAFVRISGFYRRVKNSISWVDLKPQNIDRLTVRGVEINPRINPFDFLSVALSFVMKRAEEERIEADSVLYWSIDGNIVRERRAPYLPKRKFTGSIEWKARSNTFITFTSIYTGEKIAYFSNYPKEGLSIKGIGDMTISNIHILQKVGERFSLSLRVNNILDKKYKANFGFSLDDGDYPAQGRSISLGFNFNE